MPRIEIELTSARADGTWTWRAAGARQPKGTLDGAVLYDGAKVGDVVKAESEMGLDGIHVTSVLAPKAKRPDPERLAFLGPGRDEGGVTGDGVAAARRGERPRSARSERERSRPGERERSRPVGAGEHRERRPPRRDAPPGGGGARGDRRERPDRSRTAPERGPGSERPAASRPEGRPRRDSRPARPERADRPRPKRLQPGRKHRDAALAELPPEQRPVAEHVLRGGMPAVRQALAEQNARARAAGEPEVKAEALIAMAESLVPVMRSAEWRDRAEAAAGAIDEIGLRDLRAVVAGSESAGRDEESRALAKQLREALERRNAEARDSWLSEIRQSVSDGRLVRALRVSARPPEPGARLPEDLAKQMSESTGAALTSDATTDRWMAILEAAVSSPVRAVVRPAGLPREPSAQLRKAVMLAAPRMPGLRELLGGPPPSAGAATSAAAPAVQPGRPAEADQGDEVTEAPEAAEAPQASEAAEAAEPAKAEEPAEPAGSSDDGDDAVLVEELR